MRLTLVTLAFFSTALTAVSAQQPTPPPQPAPQKLEARADLVLVDVTVVDGNGKPIPDLTAKDFDLRVNGQPRAIHTVQFISTVGLKSTTEETPRDAQYSSNDGPSSGRLLLFAVDENHLRFGSAAGVMRTVDLMMDAMAPGDLVGVARIPQASGGLEPTTDRARVRRVLESVTGKQPPKSMHNLRLHEAWAFESNNTNLWARVLERECGTAAALFVGPPGGVPGTVGGGGTPDQLSVLACVRQVEGEAKGAIADASARGSQSIRALEQLMTSIRSYRMPVTVVLISEGLFIARDRNDLTNYARRASDARVTLHAVQPGQSMFDHDKPEVTGAGFGDDPLMAEGLEMLAGYTRGSFHKIATGTGKGVFERLSRELTGYYLLSFEPTEIDRSSKNRAIKVDVQRRGVTVRARSTYSLPDTGSETAVAPEEQVKQLLIAPLPTAGLPIRVATYSVTNPQDSRVRVILSAELGDAAMEAAEWPIGMLVLDKNNKFVVNTIAPMKLAPASARPGSRQLLLTQMLLEPGEYTLRFAAASPDGRSGSVHHTIRAGLSPLGGDNGIRTSDLILSSEPTTSGATPRPTPSAVIDSEMLSTVLELTGDPQRLAKARVTVEVADKETAAALLKMDAQSASRATGAQRAFAASLRIGLLPPGEYVARAIVTVPGQRDSMIVRPFRISPAATGAGLSAEPRRTAAETEEAPIPTPRSQIMVPLPRFSPDEVLKPAVVRLFIDDLRTRFKLSASATAVLDYASKGVFAAPPADSRTEDGDEPALAFVRGLAALQKNEIAQAAAWFQVTLRAASDYLGAAFYLGATHAMSGRDKDAVGAWQMSLLSDASSVVYPVVVDGWLRAGDGQAALDLIAESPNAWPDAEARLRRVAVAQAMLGQYGPALENAQQVLQRRPEDHDMLLLAIQVLYRQHANAPLTGKTRDQFADYTARYEKAQGPQLALVQTWRKAVLR